VWWVFLCFFKFIFPDRRRTELRGRQFFNQLLRAGSAGAAPWFFAVLADLSHATPRHAHRVRTLLEHAHDDRRARRVPLLWRMRMQLEAAQAGSAHARNVFYRAVQVRPALKVLYLDAARLCPDLLQEV
jgi:hypothetical protein